MFSRTSININEEGIKSILETFMNKRLFVQGSKLNKEIVLENPNRKKIYQFINKNPGLYLNKLIKHDYTAAKKILLLK